MSYSYEFIDWCKSCGYRIPTENSIEEEKLLEIYYEWLGDQ